MIRRILLAVDDSPAGLAAARSAMQLAQACEADVRAVTVLLDGLLESVLSGIGGRTESSDAVRARRGGGQTALLRHVVDLGRSAGIVPETVALAGDPSTRILDEARSYRPDVIVIGRSDRRQAGQPYVGSEVRQVLEFAEIPVLVVPADGFAG
jgi:nucleotide-binding universal stress UspA family protein